MTPFIETAKKHAKILGTPLGSLLGGNKQSHLFKDSATGKRVQYIAMRPEFKKERLLKTLCKQKI